MTCIQISVIIIDAQEWTQIPATGTIPPPVSGYIAVLLGTTVVKYGGGIQGTGPNNTTYFAETFLFNINTFVWTQVTNPSPIGRMFAEAVAINNHELLMYGGVQYLQVPLSVTVFDEYWKFNLNTHTWTQIFVTGTVPSPRYEHAMVFDPVGNNFYIWGGFEFDFVTLGDMYSCSVSSLVCSAVVQTGNVPIPRVSFILRNLDAGHFLGATGYSPDIDSSEVCSGLFVFNIATGQWVRKVFHIYNPLETGRYPTPREAPAFDIVDDVIVVFAGDTDGPNYYNLVNDTLSYNLFTREGCGPITEKDVWQFQQNVVGPDPIKRVKSVVYQGGMYTFGGLLDGDFIGKETDTSNVYKYTPCS